MLTLRPSSEALSAETSTRAAAPSASMEELPAVMVPPSFTKAGNKLANLSGFTCSTGRYCASGVPCCAREGPNCEREVPYCVRGVPCCARGVPSCAWGVPYYASEVPYCVWGGAGLCKRGAILCKKGAMLCKGGDIQCKGGLTRCKGIAILRKRVPYHVRGVLYYASCVGAHAASDMQVQCAACR